MRDDFRNRLLNKEMTRKEFLQYTVGALLVVFGFGNLLSLLTHRVKDKVSPGDDSRHGFGSRKFGG